MYKVYLAGPSVFKMNATKIAEEMKEACQQLGIIPLQPIDNNIDISEMSPIDAARNIAQANVTMIQEADAMIADISCFRGTAMDVGTAMEVGMAVQRGIPVYTYTHEKRPEYFYRVIDTDNDWIKYGKNYLDGQHQLIENFGQQENLMISSTTDYTNQGYVSALELIKAKLG